jgi:alpha-L-fucosidase 2
MNLRRRVWGFLAAFLATSTATFAQTCPSIEVRNPEGNYIVPGVKGDIRYAGNFALDAYVQEGARQRASVIVIHGGNWSSGSRVAHVGQLIELLTKAGYNWFSIDYRVNGLARYEASLTDIKAAIAFIRCRAADFAIDPNQLVLLGEDSGAHLAALLTRERLPGVVAAVLIGGYYNLQSLPFSADVGSDLLSRASLITAPAATMTPLLVVHGAADSESPPEHARKYCDSVAQSGGRCKYVEVAGASHRSENWWPNQWDYKQALTEWLAGIAAPPGRAKPYAAGALTKDVPYRSSPALALDAYIPHAPAPVPAVIVAHGGGWEAGDKVTYITPMLEPLARANLAWFSIDYRLTPAFSHDEQLDDLRQAIRFVRAEYRRFNIDPSRIFLLGESASAQMVSLIATEDRSLAGVVSFYGVYDFNAMVTDASPRSLLVRLFRRTELNEAARDELRRYSPLSRAHKDMPALLLVNGTGERLWTQAQTFDRRLSELGVNHELIALEGAPHGMENWEGHSQWMFYKQRVVDWILQKGTRQTAEGKR